MKQILHSYRTGELWLADVPVPSCGTGGALVRTRCSVVSAGTERMILDLAARSLLAKARLRPDLVKALIRKVRIEGFRPALAQAVARLEAPITLGYSAAGEVVEAGRAANDLVPGDRVAVAGAGHATHAEFNAVPRNLCVKIPAGVSYADAAFTTCGAIALQGVRRTGPLIGERIVVIGLGLLGLLTVQILKANGCAVLGVEPDAERQALARKLGADLALGVGAEEACAAFTGGRGADAVVITAATPGSGPLECAAAISRQGGRVVVVGSVGMDVPRDAFYRKELDIRMSMSYGPGRYDPDYEERGRDYPFAHVRFTEQRNMESFLYLVEQGRVTPSALVTQRLKFEDALEAYALLAGKAPAPAGRRPLGLLLQYPARAGAERTVRRAACGAVGAVGREIGVGFIGAGAFAAGVLLPQVVRLRDAGGVRLTGICSRTGRSAQRAAERFKFAAATSDSPPGAGGCRHRRGVHRHAARQSRDAGRRGVARRQARLRREAALHPRRRDRRHRAGPGERSHGRSASLSDGRVQPAFLAPRPRAAGRICRSAHPHGGELSRQRRGRPAGALDPGSG